MAAAIIAMHCLPLPLLVFATDWAWLLGAVVGLSLIFHLHQQRSATAATRLEANTTNEWLLYRNNGSYDKVALLEQVNLGWCVLLLMKQNRRRFRLLIRCNAQSHEQLHRLRVLRVSERARKQSDKQGG